MKETIGSVLLVNGINGASIAALTLNDVKDGVAITLGLVSIVSTLLITRENLRKARLTTTHLRRTKNAGKKTSRLFPWLLIGLLSVSPFTGCTHLAGKQRRIERQTTKNESNLTEESRALTTAVVDALSVTPSDCFQCQVALELARQDQLFEGMPLARIDVRTLRV